MKTSQMRISKAIYSEFTEGDQPLSLVPRSRVKDSQNGCKAPQQKEKSQGLLSGGC